MLGGQEEFRASLDLCPFAVQVLDFIHAVQNAMVCAKVLLGEADPGLPDWENRITNIIDAPSPDAAIRELLEALNKLVGYYRTNDKRMRYSEFRAQGLPIGSGIVESAHKHVLQVRMKQAGQRWSIPRARRIRLRAVYRTARPNSQIPNAPRRVNRRYAPSRISPFGRAAASE